MLAQRLATAAVGLPVVVALVLVGGVPYAVALALLIAGAVMELSAAAGYPWSRPETIAVALIAAAFPLAAYWLWHTDALAGLLAAAIVVPLLAAVARADVAPGAASRPPAWLVLPAAVLYVGWLGHFLESVRLLPHGDRWTLSLLLGTFATDTGAYAVGRLLGRHKLAPRVSPGKTIEGAIGGMAGAVIAVVALAYLFDLPHRPALLVVLGLLLGVAAQLGDLCESAVKRRLGVKDMGRLFPGHGGLMDRLDSLLFTAPVLYSFVQWAINR